MGHIRLLNLALFGHHGVSKAEREAGTRLDVDVELEIDCSRAQTSDDLADTVDYVAVHGVVEDVVHSSRHKLLESLSYAIAGRLLAEFQVETVLVRIRKGNLPLSGGTVEVTVSRSRS